MAQRDLVDLWSSLPLSGDPARVRDVLLQFFPDLLTSYGDTAAVLGADWYDMLRDVPASAKSFQAVIASPAPTAQAEGAARWALGPLFEDDPETALARLMGSTQRLVLQPGRDTVWSSAGADPVRTGVARVPSGATTCQFCVMLASRGPVYRSEATAANKWHDGCDCVPTVIRSASDYPEGYDVAALRDLYRAGSGIGRDVPAA